VSRRDAQQDRPVLEHAGLSEPAPCAGHRERDAARVRGVPLGRVLQSRPQSLVGEYFIECQPARTVRCSVRQRDPGDPDAVNDSRGPAGGRDADALRQRFTLIINELGAAVAGRSQDLQAALRRAVPALVQTDNLLKLLADDSNTLQQLHGQLRPVITALANNSGNVQRFITEANNAATDTATQQTALRASFRSCPRSSNSCDRRSRRWGAPPTPTCRCSRTSTPPRST